MINLGTARCQRPARGITCVISLVMASVSACGSPNGFGTAQDAQREIDVAIADTPLPPGGSFSPITLDPNATYQAGSGTNMIQFQAACAWFGYWASAIANGDPNAESEASRMADEIRTWQVYTSSDSSLQRYWDGMIDQAKLGDPSGLVENFRNNCQ